MEDVVIIGSGIIGGSIGRELSKYNLNLTIIDKENDVCKGASKANSAIVHGGHDPKENTQVAKLNVEGNFMFDKLCDELKIPFIRNGAMVLAFSDEDLKTLEVMLKRSIANGVPKAVILNKEEVYKKEPNLSDGVVGALFVPSSAIVGVYELVIALVENTVVNGGKFFNNFEVNNIIKNNGVFTIKSKDGKEIKSKIIINASGIEGQKISELICKHKFDIKGYKGEYYLLDKEEVVTSTIFKCPSKKGKGVLVTPTVHGNIIVGPSNELVEDYENTGVTKTVLDDIALKSKDVVKNLDFRNNIRNFTGIRAKIDTNAFLIGEDSDVENFYNVVGISSPGITASPAIGKMVADEIVIKNNYKPKENFIKNRDQVYFSKLSISDKNKIIKEDEDYGVIVCRCEGITQGEILESIRRPIGATTIEGVKRRCRAGAGRCQGGFCQTKILELLKNELKINSSEVLLDNENSNILMEDY